jgi:AcrR family transcriptional regulator
MTTTAERIANAAKGMVIEGGSGAASMRKIGDALGLSPMAVYRHFPNRETLLSRVADDLFEDTWDEWSRKAIPDDTEAALHGAVDDLVDLALARPRQFAFMFLERRDSARAFPADFRSGRSKVFGLLTGIIDTGIANGTLREADSWNVGLTFTATLYGLVELHQGGRIALSDNDFRALCHDSLERLLHGILA